MKPLRMIRQKPMKATLRMVMAMSGAMAANAFAAGHLVVENAWIRNAPPGTAMMAGYGVLHNVGDAPVTVTGAESSEFGSASLHQSTNNTGMAHMQALGEITIAPGQRVTFAPG